MGFHNIEKRSFLYNMLYHYVKFWYDKVFYRKVIILNYNRVPEKEPLIFTPNHQNALMDALAMLFSVKNQLVFMARSDIFKKFAPILYFLKILPIYRIRDGIDTLKKNKAVFDKTIDVLNAYNGLVILPEGNHKDQRRLRSLKKGFARIAFQTMEEGELTKGIRIVPVGIDYDDYVHCRSRQLINFGDPISVDDFLNDYRENPAIGLNRIKERLAGCMKPLMINIESGEYYELIDSLRVVKRKEMCLKMNLNPDDEADGFYADQKFVELMMNAIEQKPNAIADLNKQFHRLIKLLDKYKIQLKEFRNRSSISGFLFKILVLIATLPLFLYGYVNHLLAFQVPYRLTQKVKDEMFRTSFMFVLTLVFFPVFYLIQVFIVLAVFESWPIALGYFLSLPLFAIIAWKWFNLFKRTVLSLRKIKFSKTNDFKEASLIYDNIMQQTSGLTKL